MENIKKERKIATFEINEITAKTSSKGETYFVIGGYEKPLYVWDKKLVELMSNNEFDVGDKVNVLYEDGKYFNAVNIEFLDIKVSDNKIYVPEKTKKVEEDDYDNKRQMSIHRSVSVNNTALIMSSLIEKGFVDGFDEGIADKIFKYFLNKLN